MRALIVFGLAAFVGAALGGACTHGHPCSCPPHDPLPIGTFAIHESSWPDLAGGTVEVTQDKVIVRTGTKTVTFAWQ